MKNQVVKTDNSRSWEMEYTPGQEVEQLGALLLDKEPEAVLEQFLMLMSRSTLQSTLVSRLLEPVVISS